MAEKEDLYLELRMLDQKIKSMQSHLEKVDEQIMELSVVENAINEFSKVKKDDSIKVPLANGIFIDATVNDTNKLIVNVGSNVIVEKTIPEVHEMLEKQNNELVEYREQIVDQFQAMIKRVEEIQTEFE